MSADTTIPRPRYGAVRSVRELGGLARARRKARKVPLETLSGVSGLGMRFLSEFERGKETAEIGKALEALNAQGLELLVLPRSAARRVGSMLARERSRGGHGDGPGRS